MEFHIVTFIDIKRKRGDYLLIDIAKLVAQHHNVVAKAFGQVHEGQSENSDVATAPAHDKCGLGALTRI